jgi:hypothetical protein
MRLGKAGLQEPIMVVLMKLHTNHTLSFVYIGNNSIPKNKILPLAVVVLITFADQPWMFAIHFLQLLNDIEGHDPMVNSYTFNRESKLSETENQRMI